MRLANEYDSNCGRGFTLIELLIVIAIILVLIAIALPNFLEAQIRARVTKAKGELRTIHVAMDAYYLDWGFYPSESEDDILVRGGGSRGMMMLTTPIAYIPALLEDPFSTFDGERTDGTFVVYESGGIETTRDPGFRRRCMETWAMWSKGPDNRQDISGDDSHFSSPVFNYAPTNGTKSGGSIFRWGGDAFWIGVAISAADRNTFKRLPTSAVGLFVDNRRYLHVMPHF